MSSWAVEKQARTQGNDVFELQMDIWIYSLQILSGSFKIIFWVFILFYFGWTNGRTNEPTNKQTDKPSYRCMDAS